MSFVCVSGLRGPRIEIWGLLFRYQLSQVPVLLMVELWR